jgi:hypothetical protein
MRKTRDGEKVSEPLVRGALKTSARVAEASRRRSRRPERSARILAADPTVSSRHGQVIVFPQRHGERVAEGLRLSTPRNIDSLSKYRPVSKNHRVSLTFSGDAGVAMGKLMRRLELANPNEVVKLAIALLLTVEGQEIRLTDIKTGEVQVVEI